MFLTSFLWQSFAGPVGTPIPPPPHYWGHLATSFSILSHTLKCPLSPVRNHPPSPFNVFHTQMHTNKSEVSAESSTGVSHAKMKRSRGGRTRASVTARPMSEGHATDGFFFCGRKETGQKTARISGSILWQSPTIKEISVQFFFLTRLHL